MRLASMLVVGSFLLVFLGTSVLAEPIRINFSHVVAENTPKGIGANLFKELAEMRTQGRVQVTVFPNASVADDDEVFDALIHNEIQMAAPSFGKFSEWTEVLQVFDLPFLFKDINEVHRFQSSKTGQILLDSVTDQGVKGLAYWDNGLRVISANNPLRLPSDTKGLVFRVEPSDMQAAQFEVLNAIPEKLPFSMVYEALETGLIDGQQNAWSNIWSQKFYEHQKYFTETNHSYLGYMLITSTKFWNGLPKDIREELNSVIEDVTKEVNKRALEQSSEHRRRVQDSGKAEILILTPEQHEAWRDAMRPVWKSFESRIGKEIIDAALTSTASE